LISGYPYHFIPLLVFYYCVSPILIPIGKRFPWILLGVISLYQLFLMNIRIPNSLGFEYPAWANMLAPPVIWGSLAKWAIYFPLGIVLSLHAKSISPVLERFRWFFGIGTVVLFGLFFVDKADIRSFPLAEYLVPLPFVFLLPLIRRDSIPLVQWFEKIGKRAYGLYLAHLLTIFIVLYLVEILIDGLFFYPLILVFCLFVLAVWIPMTLMGVFERSPTQVVYRYVFG
jgi:peptidoglycan/LPS O-acetylase OafA/YrhL